MAEELGREGNPFELDHILLLTLPPPLLIHPAEIINCKLHKLPPLLLLLAKEATQKNNNDRFVCERALLMNVSLAY